MLSSVFNLRCHAHARFRIYCSKDGCCLLFTKRFVVCDVHLYDWCLVGLSWATGRLSDLPLLCTQIGHQLLYGRCVNSCSCRSCGVGSFGVAIAFAFFASCCSSLPSSMNSSLYVTCSSKLVDPVHSVLSVACLCVVQSSSYLCPLCPLTGFTSVCLFGRSLLTSGPLSACCGI